MKRMFVYPLTPVILVLALTGCGGSTPSDQTDSSPVASSPAPATSAASAQPSDGDCSLADVTGSTSNAALQSLATEVYSSLQCGTSESLPDQLKAKGDDPAIQAKAQEGGISVSVDSAAGGTVMQLVSGTSACTVTVLDSTDAKSLNCLDL